MCAVDATSAPTNPPPITTRCEPGTSSIAERARVAERSKLVHPGRKIEWQPARPGSGSQYELVERHVDAAFRAYDALDRVDLLDPGTEPKLDSAVVPVRVLAEQERLLVARTEQELL